MKPFRLTHAVTTDIFAFASIFFGLISLGGIKTNVDENKMQIANKA